MCSGWSLGACSGPGFLGEKFLKSVFDSFRHIDWRSVWTLFCRKFSIFRRSGLLRIFFLWLFHWISFLLLWLFFSCASIRWISAKCRFFDCSWNLGQLFGPTLWELYICPLDCFVWLGLPSVQQRYKCSLSFQNRHIYFVLQVRYFALTVFNLNRKFTKRENKSPWLKWEYTTSLLELGVGFWAPANFCSNLLLINLAVSYSLNAIDPQSPLSSNHKIKRLGVCHKCRLKDTVRTKHTGSRAWHEQSINRIGPVWLQNTSLNKFQPDT